MPPTQVLRASVPGGIGPGPASDTSRNQVGSGGRLEILLTIEQMAWSGQVPADCSTARLPLSPGLHIVRMHASSLRFLVAS
ncbi:MAG: hypothetical protein AAB214_02760 [Fibrobacterota bacterium]